MKRIKLKTSLSILTLLGLIAFMVIAEVQPNDARTKREAAYQTYYPEYPPSNSWTDEVQESLFKKSMDTYTEPCNDFYRYACGNWQSDKNQSYEETLTKLDFEIQQEMQSFLNVTTQNRGKQPKFVRDLYYYYKSCRMTPTPETVIYMKWLEKNENGLQWPLNLESENQNYAYQYDWIHMLAMLRKYGMNDVIFHELASPTDSNPNILTLELGRPLSSDKTPETKLRYDVVTGTLRFLMAQKEYHDLWDNIQELDAKLLELQKEYEVEDEVMFSTLGDMKTFSWLQRYVRVLLETDNLSPSMPMVITNLPYLRAVVLLLDRYDSKFVCEYLQVKFLSYINYKQFQPQYRDCVTSTRLLLPLPSQYLYEQHHPELQYEIAHVNEMFGNLKRNFQKIINWNVYNFDDSSLKYLSAKLRTLHLRIGFLNAKGLEYLYRDLNLSPHDYYGNRLKIYNYHFKVTHRRLNVRLKRDAYEFLTLEEHDTASGLLPYIMSRHRAVVVPLSLLQHPFYRPELPIAYQYSSIGFLIARKIIWEFSIADIDINAYGQIFAPMLDKFLSEQSFKDDYDHMSNLHPGESEEIDSAIVGLKLAFRTFREEHGNDLMTKSFFLNFAQMFCGKMDSNYHRPSKNSQNGKIVNTAVTHVGDFYRIYGCERGEIHGVLYWGTKHDDVH